jgi:hypothetical protein
VARQNKREVSREIRKIAQKAKEAMYDWIYKLQHEPSEKEMMAWQAGYIAGLNQNKEN